jgi:hypothetical protein
LEQVISKHFYDDEQDAEDRAKHFTERKSDIEDKMELIKCAPFVQQTKTQANQDNDI